MQSSAVSEVPHAHWQRHWQSFLAYVCVALVSSSARSARCCRQIGSASEATARQAQIKSSGKIGALHSLPPCHRSRSFVQDLQYGDKEPKRQTLNLQFQDLNVKNPQCGRPIATSRPKRCSQGFEPVNTHILQTTERPGRPIVPLFSKKRPRAQQLGRVAKRMPTRPCDAASPQSAFSWRQRCGRADVVQNPKAPRTLNTKSQTRNENL